MAVESAADLAAFFDEDEFASLVSINAGAAVPALVDGPTRREEMDAGGLAVAEAPARVVTLPKTSHPTPARGDTIAVASGDFAGETLEVMAWTLEFSGRVWRLDCALT